MKLNLRKINQTDIKNKIINLSKDFQFDECKITRAKLKKNIQNKLYDFIDKEYYGEMQWIKDSFHRRKSPEFMWEDAETAIVSGKMTT